MYESIDIPTQPMAINMPVNIVTILLQKCALLPKGMIKSDLEETQNQLPRRVAPNTCMNTIKDNISPPFNNEA